MALVLVGSVVVTAAPASATDDGRCDDGFQHDACKAVTCPLAEGPLECLGLQETGASDVGVCEEGVGVTVDGSETCAAVDLGKCTHDPTGSAAGLLCVDDPRRRCVLFSEPVRSFCEG